MSEATAAENGRKQLIFRHPVVTRLTHWINVLCVSLLIMSGLQIFNAHPSLEFGQRSSFEKPFLEISARNSPTGPIGETAILGHAFNTSGVLGLSRNANGDLAARAFPRWITIPSYQDLATGRAWHFFFAWLLVINGLVYFLFALVSRRLWRDLVPSWADIRHLPATFVEHLRLHFPRGEEARHYNPLQKITYLGMVVVVFPLLIFSGLTMSPGLNAAFPFMLDILGGRQSARSIHFICATLIVLFIIIHIVMVLISGVLNNLRSMITGYYALPPEEKSDEKAA